MREFTNRLIEMVEDGSFDPIDALRACLKYMSEDEVEDMCNMNDFTDYMFDSDEEEDEDEDEVEDMFDFEDEDDVEEFDPPQEFTHVNDIWDTLEQCETLDQIEDVITSIPLKFGRWFCEQTDEDEEVLEFEVTNEWWDDNQQDLMTEKQRLEIKKSEVE